MAISEASFGHRRITYQTRQESPTASSDCRAVRAYQIDLPLQEGTIAGQKAIALMFSTALSSKLKQTPVLRAEENTARWVNPYLPAYALGVRLGLAELAPHLIGPTPLALTS